MDQLPTPLIIEILSRLGSSDLARCRVASKTINAISAEVRSIDLQCSFDRYTKSRSPATSALITPFKTIFNKLVLSMREVESVSLGVEKPLLGISYDYVEDESDDLYLTDANFVAEWLPLVAGRLRSISISDFWIQSCWRRSDILSLISSWCHSLLELELKNAWLSVDHLNLMPMLTSLTLEFIRLDDEDLNRVNDCFPSLQVLNLIGVGGFKDPKICLFHLRICQWTVSNAPFSLTVIAPNLIQLKLKCVKPNSLVINAPMLSDFHLTLDKADNMEVKGLLNLKNLQLKSTYLCSVVGTFPCGGTIENLSVDSPQQFKSDEATELSLERLFDVFPNVRCLTLGPRAWLDAETWFLARNLEVSDEGKGVKEIIAHLFVHDIEITLSFIFFLLERCTNLTDMALLIHREVEPSTSTNLMLKCVAHCVKVRWRWGFWKEGTEDAWISDGI